MSDDTARVIDLEVRRFIDAAHDQATRLLTKHSKELQMMSDALMKYETIDGKQIDQIMKGEEPDPPEGWNDSSSSGGKEDPDDKEGRSTIGGPAEQH
jgi:cell division protease FtsH